ncbi:hypothetical protein DPMN_011558 [Dreissena polymorpha]|uniref:Uncharacterized protein n=1 Tax=Dreissena polymorpha TaxID=45954 RepID=A0A9D4N3V7_DREPO|nr:hypothetical protein DPMN_011558 [Dreissena polymorpha]
MRLTYSRETTHMGEIEHLGYKIAGSWPEKRGYCLRWVHYTVFIDGRGTDRPPTRGDRR